MDADGEARIAYPMNVDEAKEALDAIISFLYQPVFLATLAEWSQLRMKCKRKAMKWHSLGRVAGKLNTASTCDELMSRFRTLSPEEAYALMRSLTSLRDATHPNMTLLDTYRDVEDYLSRWVAVMVGKTLEWAQSQNHLVELDEYLGYRD